jgi:Outer membrane lipoprotein-sorting protein
MKKYISFLIIVLTAITVYGQDNLKTVLAKTDAALHNAGGIESAFSIKVYNGNTLNGSSSGILKLDGRKFFLESPETVAWFNGNTQWVYRNDEVNITNPTEEELQEINPYAILENQSKDYKYALGKTKTFLGKPITEIVLTATKKDKSINKINIYLDSSYLPVYIVAVMQDGSRNEITINGNKTGKAFDNSLFEFDKKKYANAEIIDLR